MSLLGIEVGTNRCRAVVVSLDGGLLAGGHRDYSVITGPGGARELDGREVWSAVRDMVREVATQARRDPISALSVASRGEAITPLSTDGEISGRTILGSDRRGAPYVEELVQLLGAERLFDITGHVPTPSCSLAPLCWLRDHRTRLFERTWRFVLLSGLISHLMGGTSTCDYSLAGDTLLFDIRHEQWSREVMNACSLPRFKLPELGQAGSRAGTVSPRIAREVGLPPGVQLILGGHDLCCNALGAGVIHGGMAAYNLGISIQQVPTFHAIPLTSLMLIRGLSMQHHVVPSLFVSLAHNPSGGRVLRWFRDTLAPLEKRQAQRRGGSVYRDLLSEMPDEPTRLMALPQFAETSPPHLDVPPCGALLGLSMKTTRGEIIKALLEGMTYSSVEGQALFEQIGIRADVYRATGGGARSDQWLQLTADILGVPVERTGMIEPAPLGAAILAAVGVGAFDTYEEAVGALVRLGQRFEPDRERHQVYPARVERHRELRSLLRHYLQELRGEG